MRLAAPTLACCSQQASTGAIYTAGSAIRVRALRFADTLNLSSGLLTRG